MSHFSQDLLNADPDALARLRQVLHGSLVPAPASPSLAERFGAGPGGVSPAGETGQRGRSGAKSSRTGPRPSKASGQGRAAAAKVTHKTLVSP
ncbi:hypothetical protein [Methylobacterium soli]|uniref:Uncharacterized protein n=1 Tax=Methylobacterium soli TaxID=553447 RepID=A0A6L3SV17_9HYPH|nr:hypothetical protein [Methylobacterium soli]KAB1077514.1 hypothetical protein F6X53_18555 [Methylobacterium soli]GJE44996.1 hypothetical protein AEGHOMDF_4190 [Methylobacterium soli]